MKTAKSVVMDEERFEKFLKERGIEFEKTKTHYKLKTSITIRQTMNILKEELLIFRISAHRQGKLFENMIRNALKYFENNHKFWWQRLWDYKTYVAINPNFFAAKQPADYMACCRGQFYLIECKSSMANRYRLDNVRAHQEQSMVDTEKAGAIYWLLILHRSRKGRNHRLFALRPARWGFVKKATEDKGYVSASWEDIEYLASYELSKKNNVWDLSPLFK